MSLVALCVPLCSTGGRADGRLCRDALTSSAQPAASHNNMLWVHPSHHFLLITPAFLAWNSQYWSSRGEQMTKPTRMALKERVRFAWSWPYCSSKQCAQHLSVCAHLPYCFLSPLLKKRDLSEIPVSVPTKSLSLKKQSSESRNTRTAKTNKETHDQNFLLLLTGARVTVPHVPG